MRINTVSLVDIAKAPAAAGAELLVLVCPRGQTEKNPADMRSHGEVICARECLVQQGNEVVLHGGFLSLVEAGLAVHGL